MYPALAVLQALNADDRPGDRIAANAGGRFDEVLWVGGTGGMEADLVAREDVPFRAIPAAGLHGVGWKVLPHNLAQLGRGFIEAGKILRSYRPDVLFFTGGYVAVPMAFAGRMPYKGLRRPRTLLYVPDIEPGLALKTLARFADQVAVTVEDTRAYLPRRTNIVVSGYPTRKDLALWDTDKACEFLGLIPDLPTLLVFGGSKGARSINRSLLMVLPELLAEMQVVHISGKLDWQEVEIARDRLAGELPSERVERYHPFAYLHEMGAALGAADLALCRAGASTMGEFPLFGLPAILVPYPYAWRYQQVNAEYMAQRGAAVILQDVDLAEQLLPTVRRLVHDRQVLKEMRANMRELARPEAAQHLAELLQRMASSERGT